MGQNREKIKNKIFSKTLPGKPLFFYKIIVIIKVFQPTFIELGLYVKVEQTYFRGEIQLGPIQILKWRPFLVFKQNWRENGQN